MAMPPHSRFACSPSEAAERIAVDCDCWLFTPCQRWNRMKHGKSRLITMKNNIDRSASTCRPQGATFYSLIIARNIDHTKPHYNAALEDTGLRERSNFKTGDRSRSHALRRSEKAGRWREGTICKIGLRCSLLRDSSDRLIQSPPVAADLRSPRRDNGRPRQTRRFPAASPARSNAWSRAAGIRASCQRHWP
jgi:hypothetical protein